MSHASRSLRQLLQLSLASFLVIFAAAVQAAPTTKPAKTAPPSTAPAGPLDFKVQTIDGEETNLADYKGKVVLIVNVASKCGFTGQYAGMEKLYQKYQERGFVVLAFPANDFRNQEPGTNEQIKAFVTRQYHVTFPMMAKISVIGDDQAALYRYLTKKETAAEFAGEIEWNFTKILIGRNGTIIARFPAKTGPEDPKLIAAIEAALNPAGPNSADKPARTGDK